MPESQLTGPRIRERRMDRGISQTDLAQLAGISPSYLNLIEHNRRRIAGKVLNDIARALALEPQVLTEVAEPALLEALDLAAASEPDCVPEQSRSREFADRYPGWAATVAAQAQRIAALEDRIAALTDRLAHDLHLDTSLHEVISVVTSIRSTASILVGSDVLDTDWQSRFHQNIHQDSLRLTEASQALATYLETPKSSGAGPVSAAEDVERFLEAAGHHVAALEGDALAPDAPMAAVEAAIEGVLVGLEAEPSRALARVWLREYRADALALPLEPLTKQIAALGYDPGALAARFGVPLVLVMRRLAVLPNGVGHPPIGLAVCDAAGGILRLKTHRTFALPRTGPACPLWPLYGALTRPGHPIRSVVELPGVAAPRLTCYAMASPEGPPSFSAPVIYRATMLVVADAPVEAGSPVGRTCQVCPRAECDARREPSILTGLTVDADK